MAQERGKGNFGVVVESLTNPKDKTIYWSTHVLGQNINYEAFRGKAGYAVYKKNK